MTYVDTTQRDEYTASSLQTVFAYTFRILVNTDLKVYNEGVLQTLTTHYTVDGVGTAGGGNVTFGTGVTLNNTVIIIRDTPDTQSTDYTVGGSFPAETHEQAIDKLAMKGQDIEERMSRAVNFLITSLLRDIAFPEGTSAADRATKVVAWNSAGTALELLASTVIDAVSVIAVKGDIVQGDASGDAAKLAIGADGTMPYVATDLLAYDKPWSVAWKKGADIASTSALTLGDDGNYFDVTGTTTITSIVASDIGKVFRLHFDGALGLTHHATNLVLPNGLDIVTKAGDEAAFIAYASGDVRMISFSGATILVNYREGYNCKRANTEIIKVASGVINIGGTMVVTASDTNVDFSVAGNWVDNVSHQAINTYFYIYINASGTIEIDDQAPDESDTSGSTSGLLRYNDSGTDTTDRRIIGSFLTNSTNSGELTINSYEVWPFDEKVGLGGGYIRLHDSKATTVAGDTFTSGAWQKRTCTEDKDTGNNVSVASSVITLEAGTYDCFIVCNSEGADQNQARLRNTTNSSTTLLSPNGKSAGTDSDETKAIIQGGFTITAQKTFEIQHRGTSNGTYGAANSFGENEVYLVAEFWKVAP